jgi:hypothetical protein
MRKLSRLAVTALAGAVGAIALAVAAPAAGAATTATVTPNTNLVAGQLLTVAGSSPGMKSVLVLECSYQAISAIGGPYDPNWCDTVHTASGPVDTHGNFSVTFTFEDPLPTPNGSIDCSVVGNCVMAIDNPTPGDVVATSPVTGNSCNGVFSGSQSGSVVKSTDAGPSGSAVVPGQTINVAVTWNPADLGGASPSKVDDCVMVGSTISTTLSQSHKPGPAGGSDSFSYAVPASTPAGTQVCDRAAVSGTNINTEKSAILCYTAGPAALTPEFSRAIALPALALGVGAAGLAIGLRRRRASPNRAAHE